MVGGDDDKVGRCQIWHRKVKMAISLDASHRHAPSPHSSSKLEFWKIIKAPCVYLQRCKLLGCNVPAQRWLVPFLHLQPWFTLAMTPVPTLSSQPMFPYLSYPISHSPRTTRQNVRYAGFLAGGSWSTAAHTHPSTLGRTGTWLSSRWRSAGNPDDGVRLSHDTFLPPAFHASDSDEPFLSS